MNSERQQLDAELDEFLSRPCPPPTGKRRPRPKAQAEAAPAKLAVDRGRAVAEAVVRVSAADPNFAQTQNGVVRVRADLVHSRDSEGRPIYSERCGTVTAYDPFAPERIGR